MLDIMPVTLVVMPVTLVVTLVVSCLPVTSLELLCLSH
jgi:hypothetical protein